LRITVTGWGLTLAYVVESLTRLATRHRGVVIQFDATLDVPADERFVECRAPARYGDSQ